MKERTTDNIIYSLVGFTIMWVLIGVLTIVFSGCGSAAHNERSYAIEQQDPVVVENTVHTVETEIEVVEVEPAQGISLQGYYYLPNGGYIELLEMDDGRILIYGTQRIYTTNFDDGLALHPIISAGPHYVRGGRINYEYNANYNSTTNDVERDETTSNISGSRKTICQLYLTDEDRLVINIKVFSSSGLLVDVNRTITSE